MKTRAALVLAAGASVVGAVIAVAAPPQKKAVVISAETAKYQEVVPGVSKTNLWGNPDQGPYGAFTRFAPGQRNALHTHSSDIHLVVLSGAYVYTADGKEIRVTRNSYILVPGGVPHVSAGDAKEGALFLEQSPGKFDIKPVQAGTDVREPTRASTP